MSHPPPHDRSSQELGDEEPRFENGVSTLAEEILRAGTKFLEPLQSRLQSYVAVRYTATEEEREDLVAEILSVFIHNLKNGMFRGDSLRALNAYVYGIARLKILRAVERAGRREELSQHLVSGDLPVTRITDPESRTARKDLLDRIYSRLDDRCREIIRLKFLSGWTDEEIAKLQNTSPAAIRTRLSRCLTKARELKVVKEIMYQNQRSRD
jgi:RNA polymerase sigma factor (sigma-70 family)